VLHYFSRNWFASGKMIWPEFCSTGNPVWPVPFAHRLG
jgi:hypothetical protein